MNMTEFGALLRAGGDVLEADQIQDRFRQLTKGDKSRWERLRLQSLLSGHAQVEKSTQSLLSEK